MVKTLFECEICHKRYEKLDDAINCENQKLNPPKRKVGDELCLKLRYPEDDGTKFVKVKIEKIITGNHEYGYVLNELVQIGKTLWVGDNQFRDDSCYTPLTDEILEWCEWKPDNDDF